jgi:hypothetical protein
MIAVTAMNRREQWQKVLDREVPRLLAMPFSQLETALRDLHANEVKFEANTYQVEIEILQNNDQYVQVMVAVDDGSLPASVVPLTDSFVRNKPVSGVLFAEHAGRGGARMAEPIRPESRAGLR